MQTFLVRLNPRIEEEVGGNAAGQGALDVDDARASFDSETAGAAGWE